MAGRNQICLNFVVLVFITAFSLGAWQLTSIREEIHKNEFRELLSLVAGGAKGKDVFLHRKLQQVKELVGQQVEAQTVFWAEQEDEELRQHKKLQEEGFMQLFIQEHRKVMTLNAAAMHQNDALYRNLNMIRSGTSQKRVGVGCPSIRYVRPFRERDALGLELKRLGLNGTGVIVGIGSGHFGFEILAGWQRADKFIMVDIADSLSSYKPHQSNANTALGFGNTAKSKGWVRQVEICNQRATACAAQFKDGSLDFVYLDGRQNRNGVLEDLRQYWPKLKTGGVIAGHDYMEQSDFPRDEVGQDWTLQDDGSREAAGRVIKGAVDDFFSGVARESPAELKRCPRQVAVSYANGFLAHNTWVLGK